MGWPWHVWLGARDALHGCGPEINRQRASGYAAQTPLPVLLPLPALTANCGARRAPSLPTPCSLPPHQTATTNKNEASSRSHLVCRLTVESALAGGGGGQSTVARLTLVDLAGSEGAETAYGAPDELSRRKEGANINQSLLTLQRVFLSPRSLRVVHYIRLLREAVTGISKMLLK